MKRELLSESRIQQITRKTRIRKQSHHHAILPAASQIHNSPNNLTETFAPEERYVYRVAIFMIVALQRSAMYIEHTTSTAKRGDR